MMGELNRDSDCIPIFTNIKQEVVDDWEDLGLGMVKEENNEAYYKVCKWDSANKFRKQLGLPEKEYVIHLLDFLLPSYIALLYTAFISQWDLKSMIYIQ